MKQSALNVFKGFHNITAQITSKVSTLKSDLEEGVEVLKAVASDINAEITSSDKEPPRMMLSHFCNFVVLLVNHSSTELKLLSEYLLASAKTQFKVKVA